MNVLAVCAGVGGLELGLHRATRGLARVVCWIEREAYAAAVLVARMEEKVLDRAPVWDDLTTFDGRPWRGVVDLVTASLPCQPVSRAGRGNGVADDRWLWPYLRRALREIEPCALFLENVGGLRERGHLAILLQDLASDGWDAEWVHLGAEEVGAPHGRDRVFLVAWPQLAYSHRERRQRFYTLLQQRESREDRVEATWGGETLVPRTWPPKPNDLDEWRACLSQRPDLEPTIRRVVDGVPNRVGYREELMVMGNAVVPAMAERAWVELVGRVMKVGGGDGE